MFLREKRFLAERMKRTKVKGVGRQPYFPEHEPDFYKMPSLPPLGWEKRAANNTTTTNGVGLINSHALMMNHIHSSAPHTTTSTLQTVPEYKPYSASTTTASKMEEMGTVISSECTSEDDDDDSYEDHEDGYGELSIVPSNLCKLPSAASGKSIGVGLETAAAMRSYKPNSNLTAPAIIWAGRSYPTTDADDVARSAQMILQEVKGHRQHAPVVHQVAISSKSNDLNEGELIMGTLNAVALYYEFPKSAPAR